MKTLLSDWEGIGGSAVGFATVQLQQLECRRESRDGLHHKRHLGILRFNLTDGVDVGSLAALGQDLLLVLIDQMLQ